MRFPPRSSPSATRTRPSSRSAIRSPATSIRHAGIAAGAARSRDDLRNQGPRIGYFIDGGYAEMIKLPVANFLKLPSGLDHRGKATEVAVIADALATPSSSAPRRHRAARKRGGDSRRRRRPLGIHIGQDGALAGRPRRIAVERGRKNSRPAARPAPTSGRRSQQRAGEARRWTPPAEGRRRCGRFRVERAVADRGLCLSGQGGPIGYARGRGRGFPVSSSELLQKETGHRDGRQPLRSPTARRRSTRSRSLRAASSWPLVTEVAPLRRRRQVHARLAPAS